MSTKVAEYWSLQPTRFRFLESFELRRVVDDGRAEPYLLTLTLLEEPWSSSGRLRLEFRGVRALEVGSLDGLLGLVVEIRDESERQLEAVEYRVVEAENRAFAFWCRDFEFAEIPRPE